MNLDTLVSAGQPPWQPVPVATDVDVWDKYVFPICGTYRLGEDLVIFTLITTGGTRSLWAYVPVPSNEEDFVANVRFERKADFDAFLTERFAGRKAVFAAAENFVVTSKSDGIQIPDGVHALLLAGALWYSERPAVLHVDPAAPHTEAVADALLRVTQGALAGKSR